MSTVTVTKSDIIKIINNTTKIVLEDLLKEVNKEAYGTDGRGVGQVRKVDMRIVDMLFKDALKNVKLLKEIA